MSYLNKITLTEKMALHTMYCSLCLDDIEIGDTYYIGNEKIYCEECVEEERQI